MGIDRNTVDNGATAPSSFNDDDFADTLPPELLSIPNPCAEIKLPDYAKYGKVKKKPYQDWIWRNIDGFKIPLSKMKRPHVQNCLN